MTDAGLPDRVLGQPPGGSGPGRSEDRFSGLFTECPISLWEEDMTDLLARLDHLRNCGVSDLRAHLAEHPEEVARCAMLIRVVAVNRATLELYEATDEQSLLAGLEKVFTEESFAAFREMVLALSEGKRHLEAETVNRTLWGRVLFVSLRWSVLSEGEGMRTHRSR